MKRCMQSASGVHAVGIRGAEALHADGIQGCMRTASRVHAYKFSFFHQPPQTNHPTTQPIKMKRQSPNNEEGNGDITGKRQRRDDEIKDTIQTYIDRLEDNRCVKTIEFVAFDICATPMDVCDIK